MAKRVFKDKELVARKLGRNIYDLRVKQGITQERLAYLADVDVSYIGMIENAKRNITAFSVVRFARALNCSVADIFKGVS